VLDTNVVLDWLVFEDPHVQGLRQGVQDKRISVVTYEPALDELRHVLTYRQFKLDSARQEEVFNLYRAQTLVAALPEGFSLHNLMLPPGFPRCRDRDDQHFLALAHHAKVDALVSKDKDLLKLKRRAGKFGVKILSVPQLAEVAG